MFAIWIVFHVVVCAALILVVLLQSSKGEGLAGSAFGGNISGAVFGGRGAAPLDPRRPPVPARPGPRRRTPANHWLHAQKILYSMHRSR